MKVVLAAAYILTVFIALPSISGATNGYVQHGIGVKEQSVGGAAIAFPQSAMSAATNPATLTAIDNQLTFALDWFRPARSADNGDASGFHTSSDTEFLIPQLGTSYQLAKKLSLGLIIYANGGMQTDWPKNFFGSEPTYSSLKQMIFAPTLAYRFAPRHSVGLSINYVEQSFEARGLQSFAAYTPSGTTNYLTNQGEDNASGWGIRLGYFGELSESFRVGAFWQPETRVEEFSRYRELFPEHGTLNIPETYGIGAGWQIGEKIDIAADLTTLRYAEVASLGNRNNIGSALLGSANGPGFGWRNIYILKLGVAYQYNPKMTLRAGWNHSNNPIRNSETAFNILSPATITDHLSCGVSWQPDQQSELSLTYWHGLSKKVSGDFSAANGADAARIKMEQNNIGFSYSRFF